MTKGKRLHMNSKTLIIIGASGHGKVVADIAEKMKQHKKIRFLDDDLTKKECCGYPIIGNSSDIDKYIDDAEFIVAVGNATIRKRIIEQLIEKKAVVPVLVHPNACLAQNVNLGVGTVVMAGAVINSDVMIGKGCIINTCASVDHDCQLEDYVHIAVGAHLAGNVKVGEFTWMGAGAIVSNNIRVCEKCMIGAGTVVVKDIIDSGTYIGVPAQKRNV